jgi:hypothetical protein
MPGVGGRSAVGLLPVAQLSNMSRSYYALGLDTATLGLEEIGVGGYDPRTLYILRLRMSSPGFLPAPESSAGHPWGVCVSPLRIAEEVRCRGCASVVRRLDFSAPLDLLRGTTIGLVPHLLDLLEVQRAQVGFEVFRLRL